MLSLEILVYEIIPYLSLTTKIKIIAKHRNYKGKYDVLIITLLKLLIQSIFVKDNGKVLQLYKNEMDKYPKDKPPNIIIKHTKCINKIASETDIILYHIKYGPCYYIRTNSTFYLNITYHDNNRYYERIIKIYQSISNDNGFIDIDTDIEKNVYKSIYLRRVCEEILKNKSNMIIDYYKKKYDI